MRRNNGVKLFLALIILSVLLIPKGVGAQPNDIAVAVEVDGLPVKFDVPPVIENGRTLVPFRAIAEALQVRVAWDGQSRSIHADVDGFSLDLQIGNAIAQSNGVPVTLEVAPKIIQNRTFIPLRVFSEAFQAQVNWDPALRLVSIQSAPSRMNVVGYYALGSTSGDRDLTSWTNLFGVPYPQSSVGHTDLVNEIALGWYSLDDQGNLITHDSKTGWKKPSGWEDVLDAAKAYQLDTAMTILLPDKDPRTMAILGDQEKMERAVESIMEEATHFQGINLDIEGLGLNQTPNDLAETRQQFVRFVRSLYEQSRAQGLRLTLTLHPLNSSYKGYDYAQLSQVSDEIIIMAYEYTLTRGPEPIAKVEEAIKLALQFVPKDKLLLGISAYHENDKSVLSKVGLVKRYGIRGIALWRLGLVTDGMWNSLKTTIKVKGT